jgi:hypothetical protein
MACGCQQNSAKKKIIRFSKKLLSKKCHLNRESLVKELNCEGLSRKQCKNLRMNTLHNFSRRDV